MAAPLIGLRFRDAVAGIDTVAQHRATLDKYGAVWWGWWKKQFEPAHDRLLDDLGQSEGFELLLVDRSTGHQFRAACTACKRDLDESEDTPLVPAYYREEQDRVFAWFRLERLDDDVFNPAISGRFGQNTLIDLMSAQAPVDGILARIIEAHDRSCILHLSDLHFGGDYRFAVPGRQREIGDTRRRLTDCILADLKRIDLADRIGAVLVTGDLTTRADWRQTVRQQIFDELTYLLDQLQLKRDHLIVLPGNHDVERYPEGAIDNPSALTVSRQLAYDHEVSFRGFFEELTGLGYSTPLNRIEKICLSHRPVYVCALNSCAIAATNWTEYGYVGELGLQALNDMQTMPVEPNALKVMALHHHLLPVSSIEVPKSAGVSLTLDAAALLDHAQAAGVSLALHGHQHLARVARYETLTGHRTTQTGPLHVLSNGSASVLPTRMLDSERNTYGVLDIQAASTTLHLRELKTNGDAGAVVFSGQLR